jgi:hypothetical protein
MLLEKKMTFKVKREDYWDKMYELFNMEIMAFAHVKETENYYVKRDDYRLRRPDVNVKVINSHCFKLLIALKSVPLLTVPVFNGVRFSGYCFVDHSLSLCRFFFGGGGALYYLSFELRLLISPLVSPHFS